MTAEFDYTINIPNTSTVNNLTYSNWLYQWKEYVYLYQVQCPKRSCKTMNWLELDKVKECTKCSSRLKAVSDDADFEVKVKGEHS